MSETKQPAAMGPVDAPVRPQRWTGANIKPADAGGFVAYGDHLDAIAAARTKALQDAARWVDEEMGHAIQDGWSVEAVQALMATRDMLRAHADMLATTVEVKAYLCKR